MLPECKQINLHPLLPTLVANDFAGYKINQFFCFSFVLAYCSGVPPQVFRFSVILIFMRLCTGVHGSGHWRWHTPIVSLATPKIRQLGLGRWMYFPSSQWPELCSRGCLVPRFRHTKWGESHCDPSFFPKNIHLLHCCPHGSAYHLEGGNDQGNAYVAWVKLRHRPGWTWGGGGG